MEYTKDVVISVKQDKNIGISNSWLKRLTEVVKKDNYLILTLLVSIFALCVDYLIIKRFIDIINLL